MDIWLSGNFIGLFEAYTGYVWFVIAILFLFAELNTPGLFFFISFAIGALCASILAFTGFTIVLQCVVGLAVTLGTFFLMKKYLKKKAHSQVDYGTATMNFDALAGKQGTVTMVIKPHGVGQVKVGGEKWRARVQGDTILQEGTIVSILRIEGNTVLVAAKKQSN